jgi:hypothetical protein
MLDIVIHYSYVWNLSLPTKHEGHLHERRGEEDTLLEC